MYVKVEYDGSNSLDMTTRIIILQDQIPASSHILLTQLYGVHIYVYSKSAVYDMWFGHAQLNTFHVKLLHTQYCEMDIDNISN